MQLVERTQIWHQQSLTKKLFRFAESAKGHAKLLIQLPGQDNKVRKAREVKCVTCLSPHLSAHCTCKPAEDSRSIQPKQHKLFYFVLLRASGFKLSQTLTLILTWHLLAGFLAGVDCKNSHVVPGSCSNHHLS